MLRDRLSFYGIYSFGLLEVIKDLIHSGTDAPTYLLLNRYGPIPLKDLLLPLMFGIRTRPFESKIYHIHEPPPMMRSSSFRVTHGAVYSSWKSSFSTIDKSNSYHVLPSTNPQS